MGFVCCVPGCNNKTGPSGKVQLHRFPKDKARFIQWVNNIKCVNWIRESPDFMRLNKRVCSIHFGPEAVLLTSKGKTSLKKDAVPTLFQPEDLVEQVARGIFSPYRAMNKANPIAPELGGGLLVNKKNAEEDMLSIVPAKDHDYVDDILEEDELPNVMVEVEIPLEEEQVAEVQILSEPPTIVELELPPEEEKQLSEVHDRFGPTSDEFPRPKRIKIKEKQRISDQIVRDVSNKLDPVISTWIELLAHQIQEFDEITRKDMMQQIDDLVFITKLKQKSIKISKSEVSVGSSGKGMVGDGFGSKKVNDTIREEKLRQPKTCAEEIRILHDKIETHKEHTYQQREKSKLEFCAEENGGDNEETDMNEEFIYILPEQSEDKLRQPSKLYFDESQTNIEYDKIRIFKEHRFHHYVDQQRERLQSECCEKETEVDYKDTDMDEEFIYILPEQSEDQVRQPFKLDFVESITDIEYDKIRIVKEHTYHQHEYQQIEQSKSQCFEKTVKTKYAKIEINKKQTYHSKENQQRELSKT